MEQLLTNISDEALIEQLLKLRTKEREISVNLILSLMEVENRKLHIEQGYPSLFAYCRDKLRYSEGAALRRIRTARAVRDYSMLLPHLEEGRISLTTVSLISSVLTPETGPDLIEQILDKSQKEVEELIASLKPEKSRAETIKPVGTLPKQAPGLEAPLLFINAPTENLPSNSLNIRSECATVSSDIPIAPQPAKPECRFELRFSVSNEVRTRLGEVQRVLSGKYPLGASLEQTLEVLIDDFLRHQEEKYRIKRRVDRKPEITKSSTGRHISAAVRSNVYHRDGGCCSFVSCDGVRCGSKWDLEIDHIVPFAAGGSNAPDNLRLLCRAHNRHAAEKVFGRKFMEQFAN